VLTAAILLAVMLLPFLVSSCSETMLKIRRRYLPAASALGISYWHTVAHVVLPLSARNILLSVILATGRAMGETMAVMMVMGNANLFPTLLGKGETIASLIALEMGTAAAGSTHYHALYAAGLVLLVILLAINTGIALLRRRLLRQEGERVWSGFGHMPVWLWCLPRLCSFLAMCFGREKTLSHGNFSPQRPVDRCWVLRAAFGPPSWEVCALP